jgi:hypothetical protein
MAAHASQLDPSAAPEASGPSIFVSQPSVDANATRIEPTALCISTSPAPIRSRRRSPSPKSISRSPRLSLNGDKAGAAAGLSSSQRTADDIIGSPVRGVLSPSPSRATAASTPSNGSGGGGAGEADEKHALTDEDRAALEKIYHLFTDAACAPADSPSRPSPVDIDDEHIEPEPQQGNMEYKLKLIDPSPTRFQHLVTQMRWRLAEGNGEALYVIGVEDDGYLTGLCPAELQASLKTLEAMAVAAGAAITPLRVRPSVRDAGQVAEILVRRVPDDQEFIDVRVAAIGSAGAGKSTLLGVLAGGELDNGHGRARVSLFRHRHEVASGQTSSIRCVCVCMCVCVCARARVCVCVCVCEPQTHHTCTDPPHLSLPPSVLSHYRSREIIGFDSAGAVVNHSLPSGHAATAAAICESASKVVSFYDFPGHEKVCMWVCLCVWVWVCVSAAFTLRVGSPWQRGLTVHTVPQDDAARIQQPRNRLCRARSECNRRHAGLGPGSERSFFSWDRDE